MIKEASLVMVKARSRSGSGGNPNQFANHTLSFSDPGQVLVGWILSGFWLADHGDLLPRPIFKAKISRQEVLDVVSLSRPPFVALTVDLGSRKSLKLHQ